MVKASLRDFVDRALVTKFASAEDVARLRRDILPSGLMCRDEADLLIALDRAVASDRAWEEYLIAEVVEFVVWVCRPTGTVDAETARWLTTTLGCGRGPTDTAMRIAFAVVKEAEKVDEALLAFVMRRSKHGAGANAYLAA
jgi:hypothetical protein